MASDAGRTGHLSPPESRLSESCVTCVQLLPKCVFPARSLLRVWRLSAEWLLRDSHPGNKAPWVRSPDRSAVLNAHP